jgi:N-acetylglucosaminyldiphosphoundecaprenol N-acetyl-beta-D-mannosaminyltransferase
MGVGGALDILAGERRRAPRLLQRLGLEWSYRLIQDPRRLARRYVVGNTVFTWLVLRAAAARFAEARR